MNIPELFNMGSYNCYVWPAYGMTFLVFGILVFMALREKRLTQKGILQFLKRRKKSS